MDQHTRSLETPHLLTATAADGTSVRAEDEGAGQVILILHPGMTTAQSYTRVAAKLGRRYRVIRLYRRQYRLDLKTDPRHGSPCTVADEVEHVLAVVKAVGTPVFLYGHSSGGLVALEALVASPSSFAGAMIYEPALVIDGPGGLHLAGDQIAHNGEVGDGLRQARQALAAGKPGRAIGIFTHLVTGWPPVWANTTGALTALVPAYRRLIPCQIDDLDAMERIGLRLDAYSHLSLPVALVCGERSPDRNKDMVTAVAGVLPQVKRITLSRQAHVSHVTDPKQLAHVMETFADTLVWA
jgi:pimeloyl-ACP methyl ester carboxylesterase